MTMLPKFYCPTCKKFKHKWEVKIKDDTRIGWYECKWCHKNVKFSRDAIENILNKQSQLSEMESTEKDIYVYVVTLLDKGEEPNVVVFTKYKDAEKAVNMAQDAYDECYLNKVLVFNNPIFRKVDGFYSNENVPFIRTSPKHINEYERWKPDRGEWG